MLSVAPAKLNNKHFKRLTCLCQALEQCYNSITAIFMKGWKAMKIDIFAHICPKKFIDYFSKHVMNIEKLIGVDKLAISPPLWDIDKRLEIMDRYEDYV